MTQPRSLFSLSASWNSYRHNNGRDIIEEIGQAGFDTVELNFSLTEEIVRQILAMKEESMVSVSSLHNMCPLPAQILPQDASPDYYSLSSCNEEERRLAVEAAKKTLSYTKRFGAKAMVLHAGRVDIKDKTRRLASMIDDPEALAEFRGKVILERKEKQRDYLENVIKSLEELIPVAKDLGVAIGVENRYYYREIPLAEELDLLFDHFHPGDLYYWHDVGHAEVFDRLGLASHRNLLERFHDRLIGIHLHDIIGPINDHRPPGLGTFDFTVLKPYLKPETIKVLEVHAPATADEIRLGADNLIKAIGVN